jgi:hypothetical protein
VASYLAVEVLEVASYLVVKVLSFLEVPYLVEAFLGVEVHALASFQGDLEEEEPCPFLGVVVHA